MRKPLFAKTKHFTCMTVQQLNNDCFVCGGQVKENIIICCHAAENNTGKTTKSSNSFGFPSVYQAQGTFSWPADPL